MADTKTSALTAASALDGTEAFPAVQGVTLKKVTGAQLKTLAQNGAFMSAGYIANNWYLPYGIMSVGAGGALANGSIHLIPCIIPAAVTIKGLCARVTTAGSTNIQLALYANDAATGRPTGTPIVSTGNIANTAPGVVGASGNVTSTPVSAGVYWMAVNCNDATCVLASQAIASPLETQIVGTSTMSAVLNTASASSIYLSFAQAFGTWPDLTGQAMTENTASNAASNSTGIIGFQAG